MTLYARRAVLVAPASDARKARKALMSDADEVILDLEDAVSPDRKNDARSAASALVEEFGTERAVSIRVNGLTTEWAKPDLIACAAMGPALRSVIVPKAESSDELREVGRLLAHSGAVRIQALLETPLGILNAADICAKSPGLDAVIIGYADLAACLGRSPGAPSMVWHCVQESVLLAARAADIAVVDGPHLTISDDPVFRESKQWVCDLGFDGTWVIHPAQIATALDIFSPSAEELHDAKNVLEELDRASARGSGAAQLDGRMLDEALAVSARRVLAKAGIGKGGQQ